MAVLGLGIAAPLTHASVFWETFDNLFKRSRGWKLSDGAYSMALPPATGTSVARTMWMFGDTVLWMRNVIQPASSTQTGAFSDGNLAFLAGNTMAISTSSTSSSADPQSSISFYARSGRPCHDDIAGCDCGATPDIWQQQPATDGPGCPVVSITSHGDIPSTLSRLRGFIPPHSDGAGAGGDLHGGADNGPNGVPDGEWVWPFGGLLIDDAHYPAKDPATGAAYQPPAAFAAFSKPPKFLAIGYDIGNAVLGGFPDWHENAFLIVAGLENANPANWNYLQNTSLTRSGHPVNPGSQALFHLQWGAASAHAPGDDKIRMYGLRDSLVKGGSGACPTAPVEYNNVWVCPRAGAQDADAVLAVVWPPTDIADYNRWYFAYTDHPAPGGVAHPCQDLGLPSPCFARRPPHTPGYVSALTPVARDVSSEFSVDWITHTQVGTQGRPTITASAFVMVNGSAYSENNSGGPMTTRITNGFGTGTGDNPFIANKRVLVVRTAQDDTAWPNAVTGTVSQAGVAQLASARKMDWVQLEDTPMIAGSINGVDAEPYGRTVRAVKGHGHMSPPGYVTASWVIDQDAASMAGTNPPRTTPNLWQSAPLNEGNRKSPIRFSQFPLAYMQPWCQASGNCP